MTDKKEHIRHSMKSTAPADCVTEIRIGNSVLVVSGFFKQGAKETAADKMAKLNFSLFLAAVRTADCQFYKFPDKAVRYSVFRFPHRQKWYLFLFQTENQS